MAGGDRSGILSGASSASTHWTPQGDVAQLAEHSLCKAGVRGSIPLVSTLGCCLAVCARVGRRPGCWQRGSLALPGVTKARIAASAAGLVLLAGCATQTAGSASPAGPVAQPPASSATVAPPAQPTPAVQAPCPYLDDDFVEQTNGQRVGRTAVSADKPHPACFFYRSDGNEQLRVQVLVAANPAAARALVDRAAPVDTSDPATLPGGWEGGKQPTGSGAVFAVYKGGAAVVVVSNQRQTIKVSRIAEQVISALHL